MAFEAVPKLHRYILRIFFENLLVVSLALILTSTFVTVVLLTNTFKVQTYDLIIRYTLSSLTLYLPQFGGIPLLLALFWTAFRFQRKRFTVVLFSLGITPRVLFLPLAVISLFIALLYPLYYQLVYPTAAKVQKECYLLGKKKKIPQGVAENFWYRKGGLFLHFRLLELNASEAYGGLLFEVDKNFSLKAVAPVRSAPFEVGKSSLTFELENLTFYTFGGVEKKGELTLSLSYDPKLLKAKKPQYFTLTELLRLLNLAGSMGINLNPFLWEFEKRLLIALFTVWLTFTAAYSFMSAEDPKKLLYRGAFFLTLTLFFYISLFILEGAVLKSSLSPLWGLLLLPPLGVITYRVFSV